MKNKSLTYLCSTLGTELGTEVWNAWFDSYYLSDNETFNKLQLRYPQLRLCKP